MLFKQTKIQAKNDSFLDCPLKGQLGIEHLLQTTWNKKSRIQVEMFNEE